MDSICRVDCCYGAIGQDEVGHLRREYSRMARIKVGVAELAKGKPETCSFVSPEVNKSAGPMTRSTRSIGGIECDVAFFLLRWRFRAYKRRIE